MESPSPSPSPAPEFKQPLSTPPKLSLFSLPSKPPTLPEGLTPPPNTVAAIPFLWEEAPGKPRSISTTADDPPKSKTVRSLDLPPRLTAAAAASPFNNGKNHSNKLVNNIRIEVMPSPTTVLGGPYNEGVYSSKSWLGSPEKVVVVSGKSGKGKGNGRMPLRKLMRKERSSAVKFSSWRWDSFRDIGGGGKEDRSSSVKLCSWRWDSFRDMIGDGGGGCGGGSGGGGGVSGGKIGKVARRNSFTFGNGNTSGFLANVYGSLKHAMPWRSRR